MLLNEGESGIGEINDPDHKVQPGCGQAGEVANNPASSVDQLRMTFDRGSTASPETPPPAKPPAEVPQQDARRASILPCLAPMIRQSSGG